MNRAGCSRVLVIDGLMTLTQHHDPLGLGASVESLSGRCSFRGWPSISTCAFLVQLFQSQSPRKMAPDSIDLVSRPMRADGLYLDVVQGRLDRCKEQLHQWLLAGKFGVGNPGAESALVGASCHLTHLPSTNTASR